MSAKKAATRTGAEVLSPSAGALSVLAVLGVAASLWASFLWAELLVSRSGGTAFCAFGDAAACAALWNGPFATAVHRLTGLPLAGWGLVWGLTAFALPLLALRRLAEGRPDPALVSATRLAASAGVVAVLVFLGVAVAAKALCAGCFVMYVLVAGYAGIALFGWQSLGLPQAARSARIAAGTTAAIAVLLLYPGLRTPHSAASAGQEAVAAAPAADFGRGAGTGDTERDRVLAGFIETLAPALRQTLADSLYIAQSSAATNALPPPRHLVGATSAPVRITEWTDILCDHCAALHVTLDELQERLPAGRFSIDSRQFPLDGACNPLMERRGGETVRCVAAKARICLGANDWAFGRALFAEQKSLTPEKVYALAAPFMARRELEACVASEPTRRALEEDIALARAYDPDGTPIIAVNGRRGTSFGPFLYAMILSGGEVRHPAFRALPAPNPNAHLH